MKLVWNAIVRNESARIERCMRSFIDQIDGAVILDTGSTDNTIHTIREFFREHGKPCHIAISTFETWEQARNEALHLARVNCGVDWDYLLLVDADMELVVTDPNWKTEIAGGLAYEMVQRAGTVVYSNSRLISRHAVGNYRGVTHEYLDVASSGCIGGAYFIDHADGANREGKALRDAALLRKGLEKEPQNGRYWYYLGQSLRDAGHFEEAIPAFRSCMQFTNWDEEKWNAHVNLAHCLKETGDEAGFIFELLQAYNFRPSRAEALYDAAKYFREEGKNHAALLFIEMGLTKPLSTDRLFVNSYPYTAGFKEEYAICGYYDPARREIAKKFNNELSLSTQVPGNTRFCARANMWHYLASLKDLCPTFRAERITFTPPDGYVGMNPSMSQIGDLSMRCVNYTITEDGAYAIRSSKDGSINRENPIHTRNFIKPVGKQEWVEVVFQHYQPKFDLVVGAEDMRLFRWDGALWSISNFRDRNPEGRCEQHIARIDPETGTAHHLCKIEPKDFPVSYAEKNWMPWVYGKELRLVHRLGTNLDIMGKTIFKAENLNLDVERLSGGGGVVDMGDGRWLAILHEAQPVPGREHKRYYYHRFAIIRPDGTPSLMGTPFVFHDKQIEFAAGLAILNDKVWITYGVRDIEPWVATIALDDLKRMFFS